MFCCLTSLLISIISPFIASGASSLMGLAHFGVTGCSSCISGIFEDMISAIGSLTAIAPA